MYNFCMAWLVINAVGAVGVTIAALAEADEDRLPLISFKRFFVYPLFWSFLDEQEINIVGKIIATTLLAITFGGSIIGFWALYIIVLSMWLIVKMFSVIFRKRNNKKSG
jgi:hypothetical protein